MSIANRFAELLAQTTADDLRRERNRLDAGDVSFLTWLAGAVDDQAVIGRRVVRIRVSLHTWDFLRRACMAVDGDDVEMPGGAARIYPYVFGVPVVMDRGVVGIAFDADEVGDDG